MSDWRCVCSAVNIGSVCEMCGAERAQGTPILSPTPTPPTPTTRTCAHCGRHRRAEVLDEPMSYHCEHCTAVSTALCHVCGDRSGSTTRSDDGVARCASCHVALLRRRGSRPSDGCTEPGCTLTVAEHLVTAHGLVDALALRMLPGYLKHERGVPLRDETATGRAWRLRPTYLERQGVHAPRPGVGLDPVTSP